MSTTEALVVNNHTEWIKNNQQFFQPPVCNKMMHQQGQMKSFFVGGPNQRKDYHMECGEELFFMRKGNMVLKVVERGVHKDIHIKEGELFLLPARIPHSPQREANTIGLVLERERDKSELDGLRYFVETDGQPTLEPLFEAWFHCTDLGTQLGPIIKNFFASEQHRTGKPLPGTIPDPCPIDLNMEITLQPPFLFSEWLKDNRQEIDEAGKKRVFSDTFQFQVFVYGKGENSDYNEVAETIIWQWEGQSVVTVQNNNEYKLGTDSNILIPAGQRFAVVQEEGSVALVAYQDPRKSNTWPAS